jgi:filamentous hemagglutinin family protein
VNTGYAEHVRLICLFTAGSLILLFASLTSAQTTPPITSSGLNTQVSAPSTLPSGKVQYDITAGTRPGGGGNLFHSFGDFNVPNNNIANFLNESGLATSNILGRVTGGNLSSIFGTIQTTGFGNANLFMMNPAGFLFGPNATLNVGGMVAFTSADYLRLQGAGGDGIFYANPAANSVLTSAPVAAFGFLGSNPGAITVQGSQFTVAEGTGISLVGGNITVQSGVLDDGITVQPARLSAPGGQINLASVAFPGEILAGTLAQAPNNNGQSFGNLSSVQISDQSILDVSGQTGGKISIRSGQLVIDNATLKSNTVLGNSGGVVVESSVMNMKGGSIQTTTAGPGIAGNITVDTRTLTMSDGAFMASYLFGPGNGGNISVNATESISISGFRPGLTFLGPLQFTNLPSGLYAHTFSDARGGNIETTTPYFQLQRGVLQTQTFGRGRAGDQVTTVGRLNVTEGGRISSTTFGPGDAGNVTIRASDSIHVLGQMAGVFASGDFKTTDAPSQISANTNGTGKGGKVAITTPFLELETGVIVAQTTQTGQGGTVIVDVGELSMTKGALITSTAFGNGPGGDVLVNASGTISISGNTGGTYSIGPFVFVNIDSSIATSTSGAQPSGSVTLSARNLVMSEGGIIQASTGGDGPAGKISISVKDATLATGAKITSSSGFILGSGLLIGNGQGGEINLIATDTLIASGQGSGLFTSTVAGGNGGAMNVQVARLDLTDGAVLSASSTGSGKAGTVTVQGFASSAQSVLIDGQGSGIVTETKGTGAGGSIFITANSVTLQNGAHVSSSSTGTGTAGNIDINAGNQLTMTNSTVTTEASQSGGGIIKITTSPNGTVLLTDSTISASVLDGNGGGGSVNVDPQSVVLINSQILAQAVQGPGGNINITTNLLLPDSTSTISASSQFGQQGNIVIQSPVSPASGKLIPLGQKPLIATSLLSQRCAAIAGGSISSFTVAGRDSLPSEPGGWVSSPLALSTPESEDRTVREANGTMSDETPLLSLRKIAPSGFLTQAFAVDASGCQS